MSAIATIKNQINCFEQLIIKVGSRLYARRLIDLILQLEAKLESLVIPTSVVFNQFKTHDMAAYYEKHHQWWLDRGWRLKASDMGKEFSDRYYYVARFYAGTDKRLAMIIEYRPHTGDLRRIIKSRENTDSPWADYQVLSLGRFNSSLAIREAKELLAIADYLLR